MADKILINADTRIETRVALVSEGELVDFDLQSNEYSRTKSNIYQCVVTRIEPSLEAVFVDYGEGKSGFLPAKEINPVYTKERYRRGKELKDLVEVGQRMIVQVVKEAREEKGAALTTYVNVAGRSIVLNRSYSSSVNVSRNITGTERKRVIDVVKDIGIPEGFSAIVRTAAAGLSSEEIAWDINYLKRLWDQVEKTAEANQEPCLIISESDVIGRTLRDKLNEEISEVLVDSPEVFERVKELVSQTAPNLLDRVALYESDIPLFTHYGIHRSVQSAFKQRVDLPSGGKLVIDRTEAMFIIDVNSSQSNKGRDVEDTALTTNLEAVREIARQMRLRDIGGLMVVDFIDMMRSYNKEKVERAFKDEVKKDKAYVRMSGISRFGMLELSRQRLRSSLDEFYLERCPQCGGSGSILTLGALTSNIYRNIAELSYNSIIKEISCLVPQAVKDVLDQWYKEDIERLEGKYPDKLDIKATLI